MQNDSIETLLLRHYGSGEQVPAGLEEKLCSSVRMEAGEQAEIQQITTRLRERHVSRRHAIRLVAITTAGLGGLGLALEGLRIIEAGLMGQDATKPAYS